MLDFKETILRTERLVLRPLSIDDADSLLAIHSDGRVMRYWGTPPWRTLNDAHKFVERDMNEMSEGKCLNLGIVRKIDACLIGTCTFLNIDKVCRRAEIGYGLAYSAWGHGYANEALTAMLNHGFLELLFNRVEADIDSRNFASIKSIERLGFKKEGHLRERWIVGGEISNSDIFGLLQSEWSLNRPPLSNSVVA